MSRRTFPIELSILALLFGCSTAEPAANGPPGVDAAADVTREADAASSSETFDAVSADASETDRFVDPSDSSDADASTSDEGSTDARADATAVVPQDCIGVGNIVAWTNGKVRVEYDLGTGTASFSYDGATKISSFYAGVQLASYTTTKMYKSRTCVVRGDEAVVTNTAPGLPNLEQWFRLDGGNKFLARVTVNGSAMGTNWISPVIVDTAGGVDVGTYGDVRLLRVPFDNDAWVPYDAQPIASSGVSYEVSAIYDNVTRNGIVVGSVTHDTWKSGVYFSGSNGKLNAMNVFGGAVDAKSTHDVLPHGMVSGPSIASPIMFVGYAADWRDLMEEYADANLAIRPRLAWNGGVPFGWNSWGKLQAKIDYAKAIGASDFIKDNLQGAGFANQGTVYVNLDSYWDNLSSAQLDAFVAHCRANGQKAGIYWSPFVDWGKSATRAVEGTSYVYGDIWLRDASGKPIELDGAYAVDPTHPGTKGRIDTFIDDFKKRGFEYVKLDFLAHGALESTARSDPKVQTGVQAYNQGMKYIVDRIAGTMFISASIAPLFPHGYAHSRRIACDTYGAAVGLTSTQYEMNSASYGWWMNGRLYPFNDPDGMVFEGFTANENVTRLVSGAISGTVFLNGDDLTGTAAQTLARAYLTNDRINGVARLGKAFRPVEGNTGTSPSDVLVLESGGTRFLAVFNFAPDAVTKSIDLGRAGLDGAATYAATDLWSGATSSAQGTLGTTLDGRFARIFALR